MEARALLEKATLTCAVALLVFRDNVVKRVKIIINYRSNLATLYIKNVSAQQQHCEINFYTLLDLIMGLFSTIIRHIRQILLTEQCLIQVTMPRVYLVFAFCDIKNYI